MNPTPEQGAVIKQAVEWLQRLEQGGLDQDSRREFRAWVQVPEHLKELARICLVDALLHGSVRKDVRRVLPKNVIDLASYGVTRPQPAPPLPQPRAVSSRFHLKKFAIAASAVLAVFAGLATAYVAVVRNDQVIVTRQADWDKQLLDDGTVVYAAPLTELRFDFSDETRGVTLVRGEALFEVAKDPSRPFIVSTDAGSVRAVGTAFATSDLGESVLVTVAEGKVAITATALRNGVQMMHAVAGQQVVLSPAGVSVPASVDPHHELMWIRNWYEYEGERVGDIVAQLNRLNDTQVMIVDPKVLRLRVNLLTFKPSQPEEFVRKVNLWYAEYPEKTSTAALRLQRP